MVHYGENGIVPVTLRQASNEVHHYAFKGFGIWGSIDFVNGDSGAVSADFVLLAFAASFNIVCYPCVQSGPPEIPFYLAESFVSSRVSCHRCVVSVGHDASLEF
jgi:hypothetical protein